MWELETNGNALFNRRKNKRISCKRPIFVKNLSTSSLEIKKQLKKEMFMKILGQFGVSPIKEEQINLHVQNTDFRINFKKI